MLYTNVHAAACITNSNYSNAQLGTCKENCIEPKLKYIAHMLKSIMSVIKYNLRILTDEWEWSSFRNTGSKFSNFIRLELFIPWLRFIY